MKHIDVNIKPGLFLAIVVLLFLVTTALAGWGIVNVVVFFMSPDKNLSQLILPVLAILYGGQVGIDLGRQLSDLWVWTE
jgi:hypothetical protein